MMGSFYLHEVCAKSRFQDRSHLRHQGTELINETAPSSQDNHCDGQFTQILLKLDIFVNRYHCFKSSIRCNLKKIAITGARPSHFRHSHDFISFGKVVGQRTINRFVKQ